MQLTGVQDPKKYIVQVSSLPEGSLHVLQASQTPKNVFKVRRRLKLIALKVILTDKILQSLKNEYVAKGHSA